jgi:predicted DNA-binding protein
MAKIKATFFIEKDMLERLQTLSVTTRIKQADYIREGIAYVLEKYKGELKKAPKKKGGE